MATASARSIPTLMPRCRCHWRASICVMAGLAAAQAPGCTTLWPDRITGSAAARLHEPSGWDKVGDIPACALMPDATTAPTMV
jgi:hypothetical protein